MHQTAREPNLLPQPSAVILALYDPTVNIEKLTAGN
jgi:hypothetical protein